MALSKLDKIVFRRLLAVFFNSAAIDNRTFPYDVTGIKKALSFGSDFHCRFGDLFELVITRHSVKRDEESVDRYDVLIHFDVRLENAAKLRENDSIYSLRIKTAEETLGKIEEYLRDNGLSGELEI